MNWYRSRVAGEPSDEGLSLVEVLVSLVILALFTSGLTVMLLTSYSTTRANRLRTQAASLAQRQIEIAHNMNAVDIPDGLTTFATANEKLDNVQFVVSQTAEFIPSNTVGSSCAAPSGSRIAYKRVSVVVTWPNMGTHPPVRDDTLVRLAVTGLDPTKGILSVPVQNSLGNPVQGANVVLTPGSLSAVTGEDGCAVIDNVTPGSYTVTVSKATFVDPTGAASPTHANVQVIGAKLNQDAAFIIAEASALTITWANPAGSTVPAKLPITLYGGPSYRTGYKDCTDPLKVGRYCAVSTSAGSAVGSVDNVSATQVGLFPFSPQGYFVWAGDCSDAQPSALTPFVYVAPGATGATSVALGAVTVVYSGTTTSAHLWAYHGVDGTCNTGNEFIDLGTVANNAKVALPFGTWRIQSSGSGLTPISPQVWPSVVLTSSTPTATTTAVTP